ncbi:MULTISPECIES: SDR family NAD(P)-dependent oxidoreductase [unclassified Streptomyces]|uniref:SDR family NAD(P)-dependent oxidoreductase n=1 Tax=unclassified Streptomyces TaxID=2593676 RepID=UPI0036E46412
MRPVPELLHTPFGPKATADEVLAGIDLAGRRMLVTGGASGIGAETAAALARAGAEVTVAVRDPAAADALTDRAHREEWTGQVRACRLDLADLATVRDLARAWEGPLHALVANAGIMALPGLARSAEGWEMQLATNYLGHFALATALLPALRQAGPARVVAVSSGAHRRHPVDFDDPQFERTVHDRWAAYGRSKAADVLMAVGIARRWADDGITANALMPSWIASGLQRHLDLQALKAMGAADEDGNRIDQPYFKNLRQGAATNVLLAASPLLDSVSGRYFEDNQESPVTADGDGGGVAAHALDPGNADRLWDLAQAVLH